MVSAVPDTDIGQACINHLRQYGANTEFVLRSGMSTADTVEFAAAASCLKHSIHGDLNLVSRDEVLALAGGSGSGWIER